MLRLCHVCVLSVCFCVCEWEGECICAPSLILCTNTTTTLLEVVDSLRASHLYDLTLWSESRIVCGRGGMLVNVSACVCPFVLTCVLVYSCSTTVNEYVSVCVTSPPVCRCECYRQKQTSNNSQSACPRRARVHVCIMTAISNTWWITHHHNLHNFEVFIALARQLQ